MTRMHNDEKIYMNPIHLIGTVHRCWVWSWTSISPGNIWYLHWQIKHCYIRMNFINQVRFIVELKCSSGKWLVIFQGTWTRPFNVLYRLGDQFNDTLFIRCRLMMYNRNFPGPYICGSDFWIIFGFSVFYSWSVESNGPRKFLMSSIELVRPPWPTTRSTRKLHLNI